MHRVLPTRLHEPCAKRRLLTENRIVVEATGSQILDDELLGRCPGRACGLGFPGAVDYPPDQRRRVYEPTWLVFRRT